MNGTKEHAAKVGDLVHFGGTSWVKLESGEDYPAVPGFPGADFGIEFFHTRATRGVNVHVTGRKIRYNADGQFITVRVEFVGDCEASTFKSAKLFIVKN